MSSCVIFAVSIFEEHKLHVLREFMDMFKDKFSDCDFYIGINYNSTDSVEATIQSYNLNTFTKRITSPDLYTGSDAGAYQLALSLLKESKMSYDYCWFAHTKGAVNHRPAERSMYINELYNNRRFIESFMAEYPLIGSYALRGVSSSAAGHDWSVFNNDHVIDICSNKKHDALIYSHVDWSYIETMYVIKGNLVDTFLKLTNELFFNTKIQEPCYFEITMPWIVSRCGYFPYIKQEKCFWGSVNLKDITSKWILNNGLQPLQKYLHV